MSERRSSAPDEAQARATRWLEAWDAQGIHRTGTIGGGAGAAWLGREAAALGAEFSIEEFTLNRLDPVECFVEVDGRSPDRGGARNSCAFRPRAPESSGGPG